MGVGVLLVRDFTMGETIVMGLLVAGGVALVAWLIAGYFERRGGFGKK